MGGKSAHTYKPKLHVGHPDSNTLSTLLLHQNSGETPFLKTPPKTIATLIIPPPKYSQALLINVLTDVSPTCYQSTASTKALGLQGVSKILDFSGLT
jgi:hypothetical protein